MKRLSVIAALILPAMPLAGPPKELVQALAGSKKAYVGTQTTQLALYKGFAEAKVTVYGDGISKTRHEYALPDGKKLVMLRALGATYQQSGSDWLHVATDQTWKPSEQAASIASNYKVSVSSTTMLGRKASLVTITPQQSYNPLRKMTVDTSTGLILKDELFAPDGRLRSSSWFTALQYKKVSPGLFAIGKEIDKPSGFGPESFDSKPTAAEVERLTGSSIPKPSYIPSGYRPVLYGTMMTGSSRLMPAVRYSDGLSSFTIFERGKGRNGRRRGWGGGQNRGQEDLHSDIQRSVVFVNGPHSYVLIGDLAESELRKVARSL